MQLEYLKKNGTYIEKPEYIKIMEVPLECIYKLFTRGYFHPFTTQRIMDPARFPELWNYHSENCDKKYYVNPKLTLLYRDEKFNIIDGQHSLNSICCKPGNEFSMTHRDNIKFDVQIYMNLNDDDAKKIYVSINQAVPMSVLELSKTELRDLAEKTWGLIKDYYSIKYFSGNINCRPPRLNKFRFMDEFDNNIWETMVNRRMTTPDELFQQILLFNKKIEDKFDIITKKRCSEDSKAKEKLSFLLDLHNIKMKSDALVKYEDLVIKFGKENYKYCYLGLIKNCQWLHKLFI